MTLQIGPVRALTSASNLRRRQLCPGSARMEKGLLDIKSKESIQGERLHDYYAHPEYERQLLAPEEQDLLRIADQLTEQLYDAIGLMGDFIEKREVHMGNELIGGHPDRIRIYGSDVSVIVDAKFGWAAVERADVNLQTRVYAVLAPTPEVYVGIVQPRNYENKITAAKYNMESKAAAREQVAQILEASEDPDAPLIPGEEQCRYCKARAICPALQEAVSKEIVFLKDLDGEELSKPAKLGRIEARLAQASDEQLGGLFSACALARLVNDPLNEEIRRRIAADQMKGWKLGKETEARHIVNARRAVSLLALRGILTRDQVMDLCELSIGSVETLHRQQNKVSARAAQADINQALESVIEKEVRKPKILRPSLPQNNKTKQNE